LSYEGLADFARARLPTGDQYVLLGESFSGPVAIALAAERPPGLVGLILSCTFTRNPVPLFQHCAPLIPFLPVSSRMSGLAVPFLLGRHATPALRTTLRAALDRLQPAVLRARMRAVLAVDCAAQLRSIAVPVLYLQAARPGGFQRVGAAHRVAAAGGHGGCCARAAPAAAGGT
jgi:pimeloyl-[acyl-carrier protein] methyl ester esterase